MAAGRVDGEDLEFSLQPVRVAPTCNDWPGLPDSVGSAWLGAGYELCSRHPGEEYWRRAGGPRSGSLLEAVEVLAADLELPDRILTHPRVIAMRREVRDAAAAEEAAGEPESASEVSSPED